jgi:hypothetical protein
LRDSGGNFRDGDLALRNYGIRLIRDGAEDCAAAALSKATSGERHDQDAQEKGPKRFTT